MLQVSPKKVAGIVVTSEAEFTCAPGEHRPSLLDVALCSEAARPYILGLRAVLDVPWKPRIGLSLELISEGSQLYTRFLDLPPQLPSVPRPARQPVEGSKSSRAKVGRRLAQQLAKQKRHDRIREWFPVESVSVEEEGMSGPQVPLSEAETGAGEPLGGDGHDSNEEEDPWAFEPSFGPDPAPPAASLPPAQSMNNSAQRESPPDSSPEQQSHDQEPSPTGSEGNLKSNADFKLAEATWSAERKNVGFISSGTYPPADAIVRSVAHSLGS